jgi:hypothetical protein
MAPENAARQNVLNTRVVPASRGTARCRLDTCSLGKKGKSAETFCCSLSFHDRAANPPSWRSTY